MDQKASSPKLLAEYRAVLRSTLDPLFTIDLNGIIRVASDSVERVFGWTPDELIGQNIKLIMAEPHRSRHDGYLANYRQTGQTNILGRTREFEGRRKDGTIFPIEISVARVDIPGEEPLFTGTVRDISERKEMEAALERQNDRLEELIDERTRELESTHAQLRQADRLASIGTLAAGLGHDMNNVLLPIRARLEVLESIDHDERTGEQLRAIRTSIEYLQHLADGLHLLARDPEDFDPATDSTDIDEWWTKIETLLARGVPKSATFETAFDDDLPHIAVPAHRLTQAILNLIVNAGEAIQPDGQVRISARRATGGSGVIFEIRDDGEGMPPHVLERCMDPFFTTKRRGLGTGLGLALVHGVVQAAGGTVEIDSEQGRGTAVYLNLPLAASEQPGTRTGKSGGVAAVTVDDPRIASLVRVFLTLPDNAVIDDPAELPDHGAIWVTTVDEDRLDRASAFASNASNQLIVLGEPTDGWRGLDATVVDTPDDFESLRTAIGSALRQLQSHSE